MLSEQLTRDEEETVREVTVAASYMHAYTSCMEACISYMDAYISYVDAYESYINTCRL